MTTWDKDRFERDWADRVLSMLAPWSNEIVAECHSAEYTEGLNKTRVALAERRGAR